MKRKAISILLVFALWMTIIPATRLSAYATNSDFNISGGVLVAYTGAGSDVVVPNGVTSIGKEAFRENKNIKSVVVSEGVSEIGERAFFGCDNLSLVTLPSTLKLIAKEAFTWCSFSELSVPEGVTEIGERAFSGNEMLIKLVLPSTLVLVGEGICNNCTNITEVTLVPGKTEEAWVYAHNNLMRNGWLNPGECFKGIITPEIQKLANELTSGISDDQSKLEKIYLWVANNIYYDRDCLSCTNGQTAISAPDVLKLRRTICDGYSNLLQSLLNAAGIPCVKVIGFALGYGTTGYWKDYDKQLLSSDTNHAWNEAYIDGRWVSLEVTWLSKNKYVNGKWEKTEASSGYSFEPNELLAFNHCIVSRENASEANTPSDWAKKETLQAITKGLVPYDLQCGYKQNISRAEFCRLIVTVLERVTGKSIDAVLKQAGLIATGNFTDTNDTYILAAYALGVVNGKGSGKFDPNGQITRQEAAAMLSRCINLSDRTTSPWPVREDVDFLDKATFASWSADSIAYAVKMGVMNGTGERLFDPTGTYTRQQAYLTMVRLSTAIGNMTSLRTKSPQNTSSVSSFSFRNMGDVLAISQYTGSDTNVIIPVSANGQMVVAVDGLVFAENNYVKTITISEGISFISNYVFVSCPKLTTITFPKTVSEILDNTFVDCAALTSVIIPASVTSIGASAFENCPNVTIYTTANSAAHKYALENGIKFSLI